MAQEQQVNISQKPSALSKFNLTFEYDKTDSDVRKDVRKRADKNL